MTKTAQDFIKEKYNERKGKQFKTKDITRTGFHKWKIEDLTFLPQSNNLKKVYVIERISYLGAENVEPLHKEGYREYRFAYWIVGAIGSRKGNWTYGQFSPHINTDDFWKLIEKAKDDGVITP